MEQSSPLLPKPPAALRREAEAIAAAARRRGSVARNHARILHELRVHQIELEMQNEELCRSHVELDAARARYFDLYDLAPVGYCTLDESGVVREANFSVFALLGRGPGLAGQATLLPVHPQGRR